ncbi:uncharacterized protein B0I36DRAFT_349413 [Microdochium trichocladiopsis]|uniref:Uncharacterized protein n=1 Tax=Microdochium trichocladiopsis TaxID=1682393 RepID=A0A9P9BUC6_9PEZI|nr:uncharacterized protein B0I36DRAFT_349413 [Microdochium trichocladiopsis]KAH7031324.1 hypothetical protein B0I36DRAFT_349413 [Microdochium trichocladiopsis]
MAHAAVASELQTLTAHQPESLLAAASATDADADSDMKVFLEYQKLAQFRDTILAGKHPKIKLPVSTAKAVAAPQTSVSNPRAQPPRHPAQTADKTRQTSGARRASKAKASIQDGGYPPVAVAAASTIPPPLAPGFATTIAGDARPEIDPIFLEKSEDLVRAELRVQRQRLEKSLREELEQRKASAKAAAQEPESLLDFNLSDVLVKALTLVQATSAPLAPDVDVAGDGSESSDSFDNNTFYSSQHDTPEPHETSAPQAGATAVLVEDVAESLLQDDPYSPTQNLALPSAPTNVLRTAPGASLSFPPGLGTVVAASTTESRSFPSFQNGYPRTSAPDRNITHEVQYVSSGGSGANSRVGDSGNTESDQAADVIRPQGARHYMSSVDAMRQPSPLVRAHDLSPYAPQPAHVSQLTFGTQSSILDPDPPALQGAPASVAALRHHESAATSPESSPYGDRGSKRKERAERRKERKKQKARKRLGYGSPEVKPEPRSPSPISAPTMARPAKRQRSDRGQQDVVIIEAPTTARPASRVFSAQQLAEPLHVDRAAPYAWERLEDPLTRSGRSSAIPSVYRPEQPQLFERRYDEHGPQYIRRMFTPPGQPSQYGAGDARPLRSATYSIAQPEYREVPSHSQAARASVRPYADRARSRSPVLIERHSPMMAPPGPPAPSARIVVDQYGREYFEPPPRPTSVIRHSAVPIARPREHEIVYERAPARAISRIPADATFEENGIIYRRVSPIHGARRVVTQPEYSRPEQVKSYRDRDYSTQPGAISREEYVEYRTGPERRVQQEALPGEYLARSVSVRPQEGLSYYGSSRVQSVRPEAPPRHYAASVHPEARRAEPVPIAYQPQQQASMVQEYDPRSAGQDLPPPPPPQQQYPPRAYSVRPVEQYFFERQPVGETQMAFNQRPQARAAAGEVVYIDDASRPIYRSR